MLFHEGLVALGRTQHRRTRAITVRPHLDDDTVHGVWVGTALRLARFFGSSQRFWLSLQAAFDVQAESRPSLDRVSERVRSGVQVLRKARQGNA